MKNQHKKTKIIATIGPATESFDTLKKLVDSGLNVARLNMSHGNHAEHLNRIKNMRAVGKLKKQNLAILVDLAGPKIRIGDFYKDKIRLVANQTFILCTKKCIGDEKRVYINYKNLPRELSVGSIIMLDDGKKKLEVQKIKGTEIFCKVLVGGEIKSRRGVNLPNTKIKISSITEKDKEDISFAIRHKADFLALSFVRSAKDIEELRAMLKKADSKSSIIAKIETAEAIENIQEIIKGSDAIMVARGDLAIEIGPENVPHAQKMIINLCNEAGVPVIVATQMLESMIHSPVPTRAEVSDIANSIIDGADAIMLSEETTLGEYPKEAVETMSKVALKTESEISSYRKHKVKEGDVVDAVSSSVIHNAQNIDAKAIIALTESGFTARMIARYRPTQIVIAMTPYQTRANQLALVYGCEAILIKKFKYVGQVSKIVKQYIEKNHYAKKGEHIIFSAGVPFGKVGSTNMMMIETI